MFFVQKAEKGRKSKKIYAKLANNCFFKFAPERWSRVLFPEKKQFFFSYRSLKKPKYNCICNLHCTHDTDTINLIASMFGCSFSEMWDSTSAKGVLFKSLSLKNPHCAFE